MPVSVLFSSRNGKDRLPDLMDSLCGLASPPAGFEVIAVDNASTDGTAAVLERYADRLPLHVLTEPRPGKNVALNRAFDLSRGELLVFVDDDVVLPENFLERYRRTAASRSEFDLFGGGIVPRWSRTPDPGILAEIPLGTAFAITDPATAAGAVAPNVLYGPNMAVRRRVFDAGLRFDEAVGPNGGSYIMGSETDFLLRAGRAGHAAWFEPDIVVEHKIRPEQVGPRWLAHRAFIAGRSLLHNQLRKRDGALPDLPELAGVPRWAIRKALGAELRALGHRVRPPRAGRFETLWQRFYMRGYLSEYRAHARRTRG